MLITAGCGTGSNTSTNSVLDQVLARGTLRIGTLNGNPGFETLNASGQLEGYDIDVANGLALALGVKPEYVQTDPAGRVTLLQTGKADIVVGSFTRTMKRAQVISFSDPINLEYVALVTTANKTGFDKVEDFNKPGIKIAVPTGGTQVDAVKQVLPQAQGLVLPAGGDAVAAVTSGQADALAISNTSVGLMLQQYPGQLKAVDGALTTEQEDCIGVPIGDFKWWLYVNQYVHQINGDGTTNASYQKYFGKGTSPGPFSVPAPGLGQ
jgi:polar amino acid transport system substrate-binding protein